MGEANRAMGCAKTSGLFQAFFFFTPHLAIQKKKNPPERVPSYLIPSVFKIYRGSYLEGLYTF